MIDFNTVANLFDESWDISTITQEQLSFVLNKPIKRVYHPHGVKMVNDMHYRFDSNVFILIKDGHTWDYTHYDEAIDIFAANTDIVGEINKDWIPVYINFKEAAIQAGLGVRARNSLVYSYKFGFDCHVTAIMHFSKIENVPTNKRVNKKLWPRCTDCYDCVNACPVQAIHAKEEPYWLDGSKCDKFIGMGDHPRIPSVKTFWHEHVHPEVPKDIVDKVKGPETIHLIDHMQFDANGYTYDGQVVRKDGIAVNVPFCRECTSQPRCSKWDGKYPYDKV
jgi:ferredoxin